MPRQNTTRGLSRLLGSRTCLVRLRAWSVCSVRLVTHSRSGSQEIGNPIGPPASRSAIHGLKPSTVLLRYGSNKTASPSCKSTSSSHALRTSHQNAGIADGGRLLKQRHGERQLILPSVRQGLPALERQASKLGERARLGDEIGRPEVTQRLISSPLAARYRVAGLDEGQPATRLGREDSPRRAKRVEPNAGPNDPRATDRE